MIASSALLGLLLCTMTRARDDDNIFDMRVSWRGRQRATAALRQLCLWCGRTSPPTRVLRAPFLCNMHARALE